MVRWTGLALLTVVAAPAGAQLDPVFPQLAAQVGLGTADAIAMGDVNHDGIEDLLVATGYAGKLFVLLGQGEGGFGTPTTVSGVLGPEVLALADANHDGDLDVVIADVNGGRTSVYPGDGLGGFGPAHDVMAGADAVAVLVADFDENGLPDVATAYAAGTIAISLSIAPGLFDSAELVDGGPASSALMAADVDADGHLDLVAGNGSFETLAIALGDGTGQFRPPRFESVAHRPRSLATADLNVDGWPDLVSGGASGTSPTLVGNLAVLESDGLGGWLPAAHHVVGPHAAPHVAAGDTDADGDTDIVAAAHPHILVMPAGQPGPLVPLVTPEPAHVFASTNCELRDFDGDGWLDAVYAVFGVGLVVARGDGTGSFETLRTLEAAQPVEALAVGDIDADGRADVVGVPTAAGSIIVRLGNGLGGFGAKPGPVLPAGGWSAALGDTDLDGDADLVVGTHAAFNDAIWIYRSNGVGGFAAPAKKAASGTHRINLPDIDGDGFLDIVGIDDEYWKLLTVMRGKGDGTFLPEVTYEVDHVMQDLVHGDLDNDGDDDLVVVTQYKYAVILADGLGGLGPPAIHLATFGPCKDGALGDVDEDGRLDLALAEYLTATVALGDGSGGFGPATSWPPGDYSVGGVDLIDVDGDGHLDLTTSSGSWVRRGDGTGIFGAPERYSQPSELGVAALADVNGDGAPDGLSVVDDQSWPSVLAVALNLAGAGHGPWEDLGHALAGAAGEPVLAPEGSLLPGNAGSIALSNAAPSAPAMLFVAPKPVVVPFLGGALLASHALLVLPLTLDGNGRFELPFTWPAGVPPATTLTLQFAVADAGAPSGVALSNAVRAITP